MLNLLKEDFIIETQMNQSRTTQTLEDQSFCIRNSNESVIYFTGPNEPGFDHSNPPHEKYVGPVQPELHMDVFINLSSTDAKIRAVATLTLVKEL